MARKLAPQLPLESAGVGHLWQPEGPWPPHSALSDPSGGALRSEWVPLREGGDLLRKREYTLGERIE